MQVYRHGWWLGCLWSQSCMQALMIDSKTNKLCLATYQAAALSASIVASTI